MLQKMSWPSFKSSFQFKLFITFTLLTFTVTCLLNILYVYREITTTRYHASQLLRVRTEQFADSIRLPLYAENIELLREVANNLLRTGTISKIEISAEDRRILVNVHSPDQSNPSDVLTYTAVVTSNFLIGSVDAVISGAEKSPPSVFGSVRMEQTTDDLTNSIRKMVLFSIMIAFSFWLTVSVLSYLILRRLIRSFNALVLGIKEIQAGKFDIQIDVLSNDEAGIAAMAVNRLATSLKQGNLENTRLQEERLNLDRQMMEAQKLESLGVMAGGIAHDFNNLLQSILGNIELALLGLDPASNPYRYILNSMESSKRAAHLTGLMLNYVGKGNSTRIAIDLNEVVLKNSEILRAVFPPTVSLKLSLATALPSLMADEAQIQQVVMNLITNAAEAITAPSGLVTITTGIQSCDETRLADSILNERPKAGHFVFLEVRDNGCGMSEKTITKIFEPFFTTKFTGRGLGMSSLMGIVRSHGGALFVKSEVDKGTTFQVLFPLSDPAPFFTDYSMPEYDTDIPAVASHSAEKEETVSCPETSAVPEIPLSGLALVVDDEKSVLRVCTTMVRLCGFSVITARDGNEAVAKFRSQADEIVIVLIDLTMPGMDGIEAMNEIFSIRPNARVILASGFNENELNDRFTGRLPCGFIRKPYSMNLLEEELRRAMQADK